MLNSIWIVDIDTGACIFLKRYGIAAADLNDEGLISRFFSALWTFFKEVEGKGISTLTTTEMDFALAESERLLFIVATARNTVHQLNLYNWVRNLKEEFLKTFKEDSNFQDPLFIAELNKKLDQIMTGWLDAYIAESEIFSIADLRHAESSGTELNQMITMRFGYQGLKILNSLDGLKTVKDIGHEFGIPIEKLKELFRLGLQHGLVKQSQRATDRRRPYRTTSTAEVFALATRERSKLWNRFGNLGIDVLAAIDGIRYVRDIAAFLGVNIDIVKEILEYAQAIGLLEW